MGFVLIGKLSLFNKISEPSNEIISDIYLLKNYSCARPQCFVDKRVDFKTLLGIGSVFSIINGII